MSPTCRLALGRTGLAPRSLPDSGLRFPTGEGCERLRTAAQLWVEGFTGERLAAVPPLQVRRRALELRMHLRAGPSWKARSTEL